MSQYQTPEEDQGVDEIPIKPLGSRYQKMSELGSGSFGTVSLFKINKETLDKQIEHMERCHGTLLSPLSIKFKYVNDMVAIKTMNKKLKKLADYSKVKEIQFIFAVSSHFNLVQIIDVFIDSNHLKLNIVMESMDQNLYQLMKARRGNVFSPKTLKSVLSQLLSAISHIHKHLFFHRDVKPENILVMQNLNYFGARQNIPPNQRQNSYIVKLADYGLARHESNEKQFTAYVSTRWYRSPEILLRQKGYSYPIDIWAFGCVAVECAVFCPIFPGKNELDQCCKIMEFLGNPTKSFYKQTMQGLALNNYSYYHNSNYTEGNLDEDSISPFGGFWDEAKDLTQKLGILFPSHFGYNLESFILRNDFDRNEKRNFFKLIKSCLTWDPNKRATAVILENSPYFNKNITFSPAEEHNKSTIDTNIIFNSKILPEKVSTENNENIKAFQKTEKALMLPRSTERRSVDKNIVPTSVFNNIDKKAHNTDYSKLSPGLGIPQKFNMKSSSVFQNLNFNRKENKCSNNLCEETTIRSVGCNKLNDRSIKNSLQLNSNSIDNCIDIFSDTADIPQFDQVEKPCNLYSDDYINPMMFKEQQRSEGNDSLDIIEAMHNNQIQNAVNPSDYKDDVNDDEDEYYQEQENEFLPFEINKVTTFLQNSNDKVSIPGTEISIKNRHEGNYDLIDVINYTLEDELNYANIGVYSREEH